MIRVSVFYPNTGGRFDMDYYINNHMALVHRLLGPMGLVRAEVDKGLGTPVPGEAPPYIVVAHLVFESLEHMQKALEAHDPALAADGPNYTDIAPTFQISEMVD